MTGRALLTEAQWQRRVTDLADRRGWLWVHHRPARTNQGWRTPVSGPLGVGWPDLILVRGDRLVAVELKSSTGRPTADQSAALAALAQVRHVQALLARPSEWGQMQELLR